MTTVQVELNDKLASELDKIVEDGFFNTQEEAIRFALIKFVESREPALAERFQREDIAWALRQKKKAS